MARSDPRPPGPAAQALETSRGLGAPIPRALASDNPLVNSLTAKARSLPLFGSRFGSTLDATEEAAGERVGDIARGMVGAEPSRAVSDTLVRPALEGVINDNKAKINGAYNGVRGAINLGTKSPMKRTVAAIQDVIDQRAASGDMNPRQGLEELINVAQGSTFNGAHMRRALARSEGGKQNPHPGYEKGAFDYIVREMGKDLRETVWTTAKGTGGRPATRAQRDAAVKAFDEAEEQFGRLHDQNDRISDLLKSQGQAPLEKLLGAAKEKGGDATLLNQLKQSMSDQDFATVGGQLLNELGHNNSTNKFSLAKFVTEWDKISPEAKKALFDQQHRRNIDDIVGLGTHIKSSLRESNTSHTAGGVILFEIISHIVSAVAAGEASHLVTGNAMAGYGAAGAGMVLSHWLASPAKASSMAAWVRARANLVADATPARQGVFNIATRNLAHTLGIPVESIIKQHQEATDGQ